MVDSITQPRVYRYEYAPARTVVSLWVGLDTEVNFEVAIVVRSSELGGQNKYGQQADGSLRSAELGGQNKYGQQADAAGRGWTAYVREPDRRKYVG